MLLWLAVCPAPPHSLGGVGRGGAEPAGDERADGGQVAVEERHRGEGRMGAMGGRLVGR